MIWNLFAWIGVVTVCVTVLRIAHFAVESFVVSRVGWDHLSALGLWRSLLASLTIRGVITEGS